MKSGLTHVPEYVNINKNDNIELEHDMNALNQIFHGDLYTIGQIWIKALQKGLIGANVSLIPAVQAAKPQETPQRPPKMKYKELPIYKSPHYEYKDYVEDKKKCPDANEKLLHRRLLPQVKLYRHAVQRNFSCAKCCVVNTCANACAEIRRVKDDFKRTMRDPDNLSARQAVVAVGTVAGYGLGGGGGIPRRLFFTSLGHLSAGALCFPKETDEGFRTVAYHAGKAFLAIYNNVCGKEINLRERLACSDDLPPVAPERKPIQCPPKK